MSERAKTEEVTLPDAGLSGAVNQKCAESVFLGLMVVTLIIIIIMMKRPA